MNVRTFTRMAALVACIAAGLNAQVTKTGTTAAKFLGIPVGPRALAMGGAFVAVANDASAMYWNPAGVARLQKSEVILSHSDWIADIDFNYGGLALKLADLGTVGINFTSLTMAEMERTTEDQPDGTGNFFSAGSFAVGVTYARNLTEWFSIGFNAKYVQESIWNSTASGIALDVGTLFTTPFPGLKFGAGLANFGQKMRISGDDLLVQKDISPNAGNNPNLNAYLGTDYFDLPLTLRIGFAYETIVTESQVLLLAVDASHPNDNSESLNIGVEYSAFQKMLSVRGGYKGIGLQEGEEQFTVGGGVTYDVASDLTVRVDYAFERFGRLNNVHKFAISMLF